MAGKFYSAAGTTYITGRISRVLKRSKKKEALFELRWLDSQFQAKVESVSLAVVQRGVRNYAIVSGLASGQRSWKSLCDTVDDVVMKLGEGFEDLEQRFVAFEPNVRLPIDLAEVETIKNMRFERDARMEGPSDLYAHGDGSTTTRIRPQIRYLFEHSSSSSFLAFLPMYFWRQVLYETSQYAKQHAMVIGPDFTIEELMKFLGILFYMALSDKGEYANYWGVQVEDQIFGSGNSTALDQVMTLRRFQLLRQAFTFRSAVPQGTLDRDGAAHIRNVLNLLKVTCSKYVGVGRDIALDEASIACRSKFGRALIVYNPKKPSGKYHFKLYVACCATTWLVLNYRLHGRSSFADRHEGVMDEGMSDGLAEEIADVATVRQHVLEVVRPFYFTKRIVNTDNYYTSVQQTKRQRSDGWPRSPHF